MSERQETIEDIIAWLRRPREGENAYLTLWRDEIADRLEAAQKREAGDAAKLREALKATLDLLWDIHNANRSPQSNQAYAVIRQIKAALSAPPRNCDVYNNESCRMAYHLYGDGLMTMQAFADWLFAPATEKEGMKTPECPIKPLSLDEAISHADEVAGDCGTACKREHKQLADWLRELKARRNAECGDCAKLREALFASRDFICRVLMFLHGMETTFPGEDEITDKIRSALGEAPKMAPDPRSHIFKI